MGQHESGSGRLMISFQTLDELPRGESETLLLYGPNGSGKTYFCGTASERTLFISIGNGEQTLQSPFFRKTFPDAGKMLMVRIPVPANAYGMPTDWKHFDQICDVIDEGLAKYSDRFDTIIVDDGSALHRNAILKALEVNDATGKSKTKKEGSKWSVLAPAMQDYQTEMNLIDQFISGTTTLCKRNNKHFILTAHDRFTFKKGEKMGDTPELIKVTPAFTGVDKNPDLIGQYFDNVWHTEVVGGGTQRAYRITTQGHDRLTAKTRWAGVFDVTEKDLTWLKVLERIQNSDPAKKMLGVRV
jgi:hypothetical protein